MTAQYLSTACPSPIVFSNFLRILDAGTMANGNAPVSFSVLQGVQLPSSDMRRNATRVDLHARYGSPAIHSICQGLALSVPTAGLTLTVGSGHAMMDGVIENPTAGVIAIPDNTTRVFVWMDNGTPTSTPNFYAVPTSTVAPSGSVVFLGSVSSTSGVITGPDTSGVFYNLSGDAVRWTADTGVPTDAPNAAIRFFSVSNGNTSEYRWNGAQYVFQVTSAPATAGFANPMTTAGDLIYAGNTGTPARLAAGSTGQFLSSNGTAAPSWAASPVTDPFTYTTAVVTGTGGATLTLATLTPTDNKVTKYNLNIIGRMSAGTSGFSLESVYGVRKQSGTVSAIFGAAPANIALVADNLFYTAFVSLSGADVLVKVAGNAGETMTWKLFAQSMETG